MVEVMGKTEPFLNIHEAWFTLGLICLFEAEIIRRHVARQSSWPDVVSPSSWRAPNPDEIKSAFSEAEDTLHNAIKKKPFSVTALLTSSVMKRFVSSNSRKLAKTLIDDLARDPSLAKNMVRFSLHCWSIYISIYECSYLYPIISTSERSKLCYNAKHQVGDFEAAWRIFVDFTERHKELRLINADCAKLANSDISENSAILDDHRERFFAHRNSTHMTR